MDNLLYFYFVVGYERFRLPLSIADVSLTFSFLGSGHPSYRLAWSKMTFYS